MIFRHDNGYLLETNVYELIIQGLTRYGMVDGLSWWKVGDVHYAYPPDYDPFINGPHGLIIVMDQKAKDDYDGVVRCVRNDTIPFESNIS
jgi:hypothetical protein